MNLKDARKIFRELPSNGAAANYLGHASKDGNLITIEEVIAEVCYWLRNDMLMILPDADDLA